MNIGFFGLVLLAVVSYAVQSALYGKYSRKYTGLQVGAVRNISMIVTGLPLLFFIKDFDAHVFSSMMPYIIITAVLGGIHVMIDFEGLTYLPIGIAKVIKVASKSLSILLLSLMVLGEVYTISEWLGVALVALGGLRLGVQKIDITHLEKQDIGRGIGLVLLAGVLSATSRYFYKLYADNIDLVLASYLLEATIGVVFAGMLGIQYLRNPSNHGLGTIEKRDVMMMSLIGLLPYVGTVAITKAFELGGFGITSLLINLTIPASFVIAWLLFNEKITWVQGAAIAVALVGLIVMKVGSV